MQKSQKLRKLFSTMFTLSMFTFGGGYAIISMMQKKFVGEMHLLSEKEMLDMVALAQSAPGPLAVNAALLVGWKTCGVPGAAAAVAGTILPPFIILSLVTVFYTAFSQNPVLQAILKGMMAGVAAVVIDVALNAAQNILKNKKPLAAGIMAAAFLLGSFFKVNILYLIFFSAVLGALAGLFGARQGKELL